MTAWQSSQDDESFVFICPWYEGGADFFERVSEPGSLRGVDHRRHKQLHQLLAEAELLHLLWPWD
jgi:hypothetical protein